jgi:hypothetical protein
MEKLGLILIAVVLSITTLKAQETVFEEGRTIYKREQAFGITVHTRGWGINYRYGKYTSGFSRRIFEGEIVGLKHPKEIKIFSSGFDNSNGFVFGKLNSMIIFRASVGTSKTFISKQSVRGIAISYIYNAGISFAYAKPVFLEVIKIDTITGLFTNEIERYNPSEHSQFDINGGASWFRGLFSGRFYPGAFFKAGLNFESARRASKINSIEVGGTLDLYLQKLPIMANEMNSRFIFNLYVTLAFGSKKTE